MDASRIVEIDCHGKIFSIVFQDDSHIVAAGSEGIIRRWHVRDGFEIGEGVRASSNLGSSDDISSISAIALSKNRKWMVGGKYRMAIVWNAETQEEVASLRHSNWVDAVDVSPDSAKVATGSKDKTAIIWTIETGERLVGPLQHNEPVAAVRFSPSGNLLATATCGQDSIRVFQSHDGELLFSIPFNVRSAPTTPLVWSRDDQRIFAVSFNKIKRIDVSTRSVLSEWNSHGKSHPSVVLSGSGNFIVSSANHGVSFWDTSTHLQLGTDIKRLSGVRSIALSPDDGYLAIGEESGKITIHSLRDIFPWYHYPVELPFLHLSESVLLAWARGHLVKAEELLTEEIERRPTSAPPYHLFANRALVRTRLGRYDEAYKEAEESIKLHASPIGNIASVMSLGGKGDVDAAIRDFDLVLCVCNPNEIKFFLLVKTIILFWFEKCDDAILHIHVLMKVADGEVAYLCNQVLGEMYRKRENHELAIESFKRAQLFSPSEPERCHLKAISLIFGWSLDADELEVNLCEALLAAGRAKEATEALHGLINGSRTSKITSTWIDNFTQRCATKLEKDGDDAMRGGMHDLATTHYSNALSLHPASAPLLAKRSEALVGNQLWDDALNDANKAINLDPSYPWGYRSKHAALHGAKRYDEAINAFRSMLSKIENSPDQETRMQRKNFVDPDEAINDIISNICPLVLIDLETGRLCDASERTRLFKREETCKELISSTTTEVDRAHIQEVVEQYFRYVMFSHVWEDNEPTFQDVTFAHSVWDLVQTTANRKLINFCKAVRDNGYRWCWSDTCCIDKSSNAILNQSLTSMYKWYERCVATYVFLSGAASPSRLGDLRYSRWMTRAWTGQELLAPKVIRFYDQEWKPYLGDTRPNHKESPVIMQELEASINIPAGTIAAFHPHALGVREKLRLASKRDARKEEDLAYSLIGVFESDITPRYGEGKEVALGHLLEEVITRTGDVTVLAWTGKPSSYSSCLPATLNVYARSSHTIKPVVPQEMNAKVQTLRSRLQPEEVYRIYDQVIHLPHASFVNRRLRLPCVVFPVHEFYELTSLQSGGSRRRGYGYGAKVSVFGEIEFRTADSLPLRESPEFVLVHPWIRDVLDEAHLFDELGLRRPSVDPHSNQLELYQRALRLLVRLGQEFSALLLRRSRHGEYKRVAADCDIVVKIPAIRSWRDIQVATLEIL